VRLASSCSFTVPPPVLQRVYDNLNFCRSPVVLRSQEISNSPEAIGRLGIISISTAARAISRATLTCRFSRVPPLPSAGRSADCAVGFAHRPQRALGADYRGRSPGERRGSGENDRAPREERDSKGKETAGFVPFGATALDADGWSSRTDRTPI